MPVQGFQVWGEDEYLYVHMRLCSAQLGKWVEFSVGRPGAGDQGTEVDPILQGAVTLSGAEFFTVGSVEFGGEKDTQLLLKALGQARRAGRKLLDE